MQAVSRPSWSLSRRMSQENCGFLNEPHCNLIGTTLSPASLPRDRENVKISSKLIDGFSEADL